jgi:radical SAM protein with 4Fe4S-binding SPASM domain
MSNLSTKYIPEKGVFEATLRCNLRCRHCGSKAGIPRQDELSTDECNDLFKQLAELGMRWLVISGGEPTTRPDWIELIRLASSTGIRVGLITNGLKINKKSAITAKKNGLAGLGISLDGIGKTHDYIRGRPGHFNRLMQVMDDCKEVNLPFAVITHINQRNKEELAQMEKLINKKGAYAWQVQLGTDMGNMSENRDLLLHPHDLIALEAQLARLIKKSTMRIHPSDSIGYFGPHEKLLRKATGGKHFSGCRAGMNVIGIESNGNIKGCLSIMAGYNEQSNKYVEGNIRHESLYNIWNKPGAFAYNREWTPDKMDGFCASCANLSVCRGGCMAKQVASGNGVDNPMCVYSAIKKSENRTEVKLAGQAAAAMLASVLGSGTGCSEVSPPEPVDTATNTSSESTAGTETNTEFPTDVDYGFPGSDYWTIESDSETDSDTETPSGTETDSSIETDSDTETASGTGIDTSMMDYGFPYSSKKRSEI